MSYFLLFIVSLLIPYPSVQHFIWPLHWCLLADICNHTYIPECGTENEEDIHNRRLFIDECDMFEYNCDYETDFYPINYSSCFNIPPTPPTECPPVKPCPSIPPCPDHRFHNAFTTTSTTSAEFELVSKLNVLPSNLPEETTTLSPSWSEYWNATEKEPDLGPSSPGYWNHTEKETALGPSSPVHWNATEKEPALGPSSPTPLYTSQKPPDLDDSLRTFIKKKKKLQQMRKRFTVKKKITKKAPTSTKTKMRKKNTVKKNARRFNNKAIKIIVKKKSSKKKNDNS